MDILNRISESRNRPDATTRLLEECDRVSDIVKKPLMPSSIYMYDMIHGDSGTPPPIESDPLFSGSCVVFSYKDLKSAGEEGRQKLKERFARLARTSLENSGIKISDWNHALTDSNGSMNAIQHEFDHLKVLPPNIQKTAFIAIYFDRPTLDLSGFAWADTSKLTHEQKAIWASEPESLSTQDIDSARLYAKESGSDRVKLKTEQRIRLRKHHLSPIERLGM